MGQVIAAFTVLSFLSRAFRAYRNLPIIGVFNASAVRLIAHAVRGGGPANVSISLALELLRDGCSVPGRRATAEVSGNTYTAWYDRPISWSNGLAMVTRGEDDDPVEWIAEAWDGARWVAVAASGMLLWPLDVDGERELYPRLQSAPVKGWTVVDLRAPAAWIGPALLCPFLNSLTTTACLFAALIGREHLARPILALTFAQNMVVYCSLGLLSAWLGQQREAVVSAVIAVTPALMTWILCKREQYSLAIILVPYIQVNLLRSFVRNTIFLDSSPAVVVRKTISPSPGVLQSVLIHFYPWIIAGASSIIRRFRAIRRARGLLAKDRARYDIAWAAELTRPSAATNLSRIVATTSRMAALASPAMSRQLNRQSRLKPRRLGCRLFGTSAQPREQAMVSAAGSQLAALEAPFGDYGLPATLDLGRPVDSLDQLYAAAAAIQPVLQAKVWMWAASSNGLLPAAGARGEYIAAKICGDGRSCVRWAGLKSVERAVEKIVRVYRQVISCHFYRQRRAESSVYYSHNSTVQVCPLVCCYVPGNVCGNLQ